MRDSEYYRQAVYIDKELMRNRTYRIPGTTYTVRRYSDYTTIIDSAKCADVFNYTRTSELAKFLESIA